MIKLIVIALIFYLLIIIIGSVQAKSVENRGASFAECLKDPSSAKTCEALLPFAKSANINAFMRPALDPCEDFYEYACGEWSHVNKALTKPTTGFFENLTQGMSLIITTILEDTYHENENVKKVQSFYRSCKKLLEIPLEQHTLDLKDIIAEFGTMPALSASNWNADNFDWLETLGRIQYKYGIQSIISYIIMPDFKNNTKNRIYFGQAELPLKSKAMYMNAESANYRQEYMMSIASQLSSYLLIDEIEAEEVAQSIVDFEQQLAEGMLDDGVSRSLDETAKLITSEQMSTKYAPTLNISRFLELALGEPITDSIYDNGQEFQIHLTKVISSVSKETLANYIFYQLVSEFFPPIALDEKSQQKVCNAAVEMHFTKMLENMIYRQMAHGSLNSDTLNDMWLEIKNVFMSRLNSPKLDWISTNVRDEAQKKLNAMKFEINSHMTVNFSEEMHDLRIGNVFFVDNLKSLYHNEARKMIKKLHQLPDSIWENKEFSYAPSYNFLENKIEIPVAIFQPLYLWVEAFPKALLYSTLGFLIGHELIHGFDDIGRHYDESGNQRNWWDKRSSIAFKNRTVCFANQYHQYVFDFRQLPLKEKQAENIADNAGLSIAYDAYINWLSKNGDDRHLPYLNYSLNQLFFISFAQLFCNDMRPEQTVFQVLTDEHTPNKLRVIGVLSNSREFAREFQCNASTKMNPLTKCEIY